MCYDLIQATLEELRYAIHRGDEHLADELQRKLNDLELIRYRKYYVSGFEHPKLLCFTNEQPYEPQLLSWGLIPASTSNWEWAQKLRRGTLNAKAETMFELESFKLSAKNRRCLVYVDGFFDHHDQDGKKYPFKIANKNQEPLILGGIWDEWINKQTDEIIRSVSIVTVAPPEGHIMAKIHNKPSKSETPRMPLILKKEQQDLWLMHVQTYGDMKELLKLAVPYPEELLDAYSVGAIKGKAAVGNVPDASLEKIYPELNLNL